MVEKLWADVVDGAATCQQLSHVRGDISSVFTLSDFLFLEPLLDDLAVTDAHDNNNNTYKSHSSYPG